MAWQKRKVKEGLGEDQRDVFENDHHGSESWESGRRERLSKHTITLLFRRLDTVLPPDGAGRARSDWRTGRWHFDTVTGLSPLASATSDTRARFGAGTEASACEFGGGESSHRSVREGVIVGGLSGGGRMNRRVDGCRAWQPCQTPPKALLLSEASSRIRQADQLKQRRAVED